MSDFVNNKSFWDKIYNNEKAGWDMKSSTPVFKSYLKEQIFPVSSKILILGSGYGYDAIEAARMGLNVTAVDFSPTAIRTAKKNADEQNVTVKFLVRDFFTLTKEFQNYFDLAYDYVTYCAIDPVRRKEYAKMIFDVLNCNGLFIALWFPVEKRAGGPPFGIDLNETQNIFIRHFELQLTADHQDTIKPRKGREVLQVYKKRC